VATDLELSTSRLYKLNLSLSLEHHDSDVAVWPGSRPEPGGQPGLAGRHAMSLWQKLRRGVRNEHWMLDEGVRVGSSTLIIESGTTGMTAAARPMPGPVASGLTPSLCGFKSRLPVKTRMIYSTAVTEPQLSGSGRPRATDQTESEDRPGVGGAEN
jgi:hypothetical protein